MPSSNSPITLNDAAISRLAREIARDIRPLNDILAYFHLNADQFEDVTNMGYFQQRLTEETLLWNASDAMSISKRIESKAATLVEDCLLEVYQLIHDKNQPMSAKVEALKWAARMAGIGENARGVSDGDSQVRITINIGGRALEFEKEKLPSRVIEGEVVDLTPQDAR